MKTLRVLMLEDNIRDAELVLATLAREGIQCDAVRVETEKDFLNAMGTGEFDLILSDCSLPSYDGLAALKVAKARLPDLPFVFVSGTIGEEMAIDTVKNGATDYVLKQRLSRLGPAVRRAITETTERAARREAEKGRSRAESLFRALFDQVAAGVVIADLEGQIVETNAAAQAMFGYDQPEFRELRFASLAHSQDAGANRVLYEDLISGKRPGCEIEELYVRRDGTTLWGRTVVSLIREEGSPRFFVNLIQDVTERKELERRFVEAQKMEVVGRLAAGVAHDFNNLLTVINGSSALLLEEARLPPQMRRELQNIYDAGERASTLTQRLLSFSKRHIPRRERLDLNSVIAGLNHMLQRVVGREIQVTARLDSQAGSIEADQPQIEELVMNLAINARDAMPEGGELTISTLSVTADKVDKMVPHSAGIGSGDYVLLKVTDTGIGMDEATKARIFEPFFTTKDMGKGTGLGLWMVHEIARQCRGAIAVDSEVGRGTSFRIYLPRVTGKADPQEMHTIVVVDEDPSIRTFVSDALRLGGYQVLEAPDGRQAVNDLRHRRVSLLITELIMPFEEGLDTIRAVKSEFPNLPVVAMSGGFHGPYLEIAKQLGVDEILFKPLAMDSLQDVVRRLASG